MPKSKDWQPYKTWRGCPVHLRTVLLFINEISSTGLPADFLLVRKGHFRKCTAQPQRGVLAGSKQSYQHSGPTVCHLQKPCPVEHCSAWLLSKADRTIGILTLPLRIM
ncbi:hypothetical protein DV515_00000504 [Chloebia gouldiae]|uniref:Uncharacterized protein n=1 Tax=Chloebia gouldiae TaxID=44316 RepID=A0A3L8T0Z3_CHLGU|nr:hypothetical protein DV515_00000504 [Chloebia gouldiae]